MINQCDLNDFSNNAKKLILDKFQMDVQIKKFNDNKKDFEKLVKKF